MRRYTQEEVDAILHNRITAFIGNSPIGMPVVTDYELGYSIVDGAYLNVSVAPTSLTGNLSTGIEFTCLKMNNIVGARIYWAGGVSRTIRCKLWTGGIDVNYVDINVSTSGVYSAYFETPYVLDNSHLYTNFFLTSWDTINTASGIYSRTDDASIGSNRTIPLDSFINPGIIIRHVGAYATGDNSPDTYSATEKYIIEPLFQ